MRLVAAHRRTLVVYEDGRINAPFTCFLNDRFDNINTRESVALSLRVLHRFLTAHRIDLASRAIEAQCLMDVECNWLADVSYRPLEELERMNDSMVRRLGQAASSSKQETLEPRDRKGAVSPNTAKRRLDAAADFLGWFRESLLDPSIRSAAIRNDLRECYQTTIDHLRSEIRGSKQNHHSQVQSLPSSRFLEILRTIFLSPERVFASASGKPSSTTIRDRAIALLAAEGLRPGFIANLTVDDFTWQRGKSDGYMQLKDNIAKRQTRLTAATPQSKGMRSTSKSYNSEGRIKLWPFTCDAVQDYIDEERASVIGKTLANRSKSFLILAEHGGPIGDRSTINKILQRAEKNLLKLGLLDVTSDPHANGKTYEFYPYVLRHSGATLFFQEKSKELNSKELVLDLMRTRFGWKQNSEMPQIYAKRAMIDTANVNMMDLYAKLKQEQQRKKEQKS